MRRFKLSYSSVVSTLALFIALGGVSYAAIAIPDNSVGTDQIRDSGVTIADIRDGNVGTFSTD